jgi:hypothetical protein
MTNENEHPPKIAIPIYAHPNDQGFIVVGTPTTWAKEEETK